MKSFIRIKDILIRESEIVAVMLGAKTIHIETATRVYDFHRWEPGIAKPYAPNVLSIDDFDKVKASISDSVLVII